MSNALASMTGYARAGGRVEGAAFACEVKSVNGRGLDLRLRLASGFDALEAEIRRRVGRALSRGSVTISLEVSRDTGGGEIALNRQALELVMATIEELSHRIEAQAPRLDGILGLRGVLVEKPQPMGAAGEEALHGAILAAIDQCLAGLVEAREAEGDHLRAVIMARLDEIAALTDAAERHPARGREAILARLKLQLAELAEAGVALSEERLLQEAILLATKADIREELDRLSAHVAAARELVRQGGPVGRKLDFLAQEFNREANTLCSKSNAVELTAIGLDLKAAIDQLREQVQNIE